MVKEDVLEIQKKIEESKVVKIQKETQLETAYATAKSEYGCSSLEEIGDQIDLLDKEITEMEDKISKKSKTLEEAYDWGI